MVYCKEISIPPLCCLLLLLHVGVQMLHDLIPSCVYIFFVSNSSVFLFQRWLPRRWQLPHLDQPPRCTCRSIIHNAKALHCLVSLWPPATLLLTVSNHMSRHFPRTSVGWNWKMAEARVPQAFKVDPIALQYLPGGVEELPEAWSRRWLEELAWRSQQMKERRPATWNGLGRKPATWSDLGWGLATLFRLCWI